MRRAALCSALAALLAAAAAALAACGSSAGGLIPAAKSGPLQSDIEAVEQAAEAGNGSCAETEAKLLKTDRDFAALPASVDSGLHDKIRLGIENLHKVAKETCEQPAAQTATTTTPATTTTQTTPTQTTPTTTTPTTTTPTTPAEAEEQPSEGAGGGTPAPGEGHGKPPGEGAGGAAPEEEASGHADKKAKGHDGPGPEGGK